MFSQTALPPGNAWVHKMLSNWRGWTIKGERGRWFSYEMFNALLLLKQIMSSIIHFRPQRFSKFRIKAFSNNNPIEFHRMKLLSPLSLLLCSQQVSVNTRVINMYLMVLRLFLIFKNSGHKLQKILRHKYWTFSTARFIFLLLVLNWI